MKRWRSMGLFSVLLALLGAPLLWGVGCTGGSNVLPPAGPGDGGNDGGDDGGDGGGGGNESELQVDFDDDPSGKLVASAKSSDGTEYAIYGDKDDQGEVEQVSQIDLAVGEDGTTVTMELDDQERPVRMESQDGTSATFSYDEDAGTVRVDVTDTAGDTVVDESIDSAGGDEEAGRLVGPQAQINLCDRLSNVLSVIDEFFDCSADDADASFCDGGVAEAAAAIESFCSVEPEEVDGLETSLGDSPREVPLGIRGFFTARPAPDGGSTIILTATAFGGVRPYEEIDWEVLFGPADVTVENLPSGVAVADVVIEGIYVFRAEVTDGDGQTASMDLEVESQAAPLIQIAWSPERPEVGRVVTFSIAEERRDNSDGVRLYRWTFGDGTSNAGNQVTHAYVEAGEFVVNVLLSTRNGDRATASAVVPVGQAPIDCEQECLEQAEAKFLDCLLAGNDEADCAERSREAVDGCLHDECGGGDQGGCQDLCARAAGFAFEECQNAGGSEEDCSEFSHLFAERCLQENCAEARDCPSTCEAEGERIRRECLDDGADGETCNGVVGVFVETCVADHCNRPDDCGQRCRERGERLFQECRHNGGSANECGARALAFGQQCFEETCGEPVDCGTICEDQSARILEECERVGFDESECQRRVEGFIGHCVEEKCHGPDLGDACGQQCGQLGRQAFEECRAAGGTDSDCVGRSRFIVDACIQQECGQMEGCEERCGGKSNEVVTACMNAGGEQAACESEGAAAFQECLSHECQNGPGGPGGPGQPGPCVDDCIQQARGVMDDCLAAGGGRFECDRRSLEAANACIREECDDPFQEPEPDPQPDPQPEPEPEPDPLPCETVCDQAAAASFDACLLSGGLEEDCRIESEAVRSDCLDTECGNNSNECAEACFAESQAVLSECLAAGGEAGACEQLAVEAETACVAANCQP